MRLWRVALVVALLLGLCFGFLATARMPLVWPPEHVGLEVFQEFREDLIDWNGGDDHGWWQFWIRPGSDRDPEELCEALHTAMTERSWAIPGIGVTVHEWVEDSDDPAVVPTDRGTGPYWSAYCGNPDFLGRNPRGDW